MQAVPARSSLSLAGAASIAQPRSHQEIANAKGDAFAFVYFEDEPVWRSLTKRIPREDARRFAIAVARLPELLDELRRLRGVRRDGPRVQRKSSSSSPPADRRR
jgi:hypothetical protein